LRSQNLRTQHERNIFEIWRCGREVGNSAPSASCENRLYRFTANWTIYNLRPAVLTVRNKRGSVSSSDVAWAWNH